MKKSIILILLISINAIANTKTKKVNFTSKEIKEKKNFTKIELEKAGIKTYTLTKKNNIKLH